MTPTAAPLARSDRDSWLGTYRSAREAFEQASDALAYAALQGLIRQANGLCDLGRITGLLVAHRPDDRRAPVGFPAVLDAGHRWRPAPTMAGLAALEAGCRVEEAAAIADMLGRRFGRRTVAVTVDPVVAGGLQFHLADDDR